MTDCRVGFSIALCLAEVEVTDPELNELQNAGSVALRPELRARVRDALVQYQEEKAFRDARPTPERVAHVLRKIEQQSARLASTLSTLESSDAAKLLAGSMLRHALAASCGDAPSLTPGELKVQLTALKNAATRTAKGLHLKRGNKSQRSRDSFAAALFQVFREAGGHGIVSAASKAFLTKALELAGDRPTDDTVRNLLVGVSKAANTEKIKH